MRTEASSGTAPSSTRALPPSLSPIQGPHLERAGVVATPVRRAADDEADLSSLARTLSPVTASSAAPADTSERANAAMDRYANGDDAAFSEVYDAVAPRLHAYLLRQTGERESADDLLQQTLLQMHRSRGTYLTGCAVISWAFAIARRLYIDQWRRRKTDALWRARAVADGDRVTATAPDDEVVSRELAGRVEEELSRLPETQRVAFELLRIDGLSHDEAAEVLGTTVSAVKLRAFRAYSAIRAVLGRAPATTRSEGPRRKA